MATLLESSIPSKDRAQHHGDGVLFVDWRLGFRRSRGFEACQISLTKLGFAEARSRLQLLAYVRTHSRPGEQVVRDMITRSI